MKNHMLDLKFGGRRDLMYLILIYDIHLDEKGPHVLRNVFKISKKFLTHIQNSVFEGELSLAQYEDLVQQLQQHLRSDKDSCIVFKNRNPNWLQKEFLTEEIDQLSQFL